MRQSLHPHPDLVKKPGFSPAQLRAGERGLKPNYEPYRRAEALLRAGSRGLKPYYEPYRRAEALLRAGSRGLKPYYEPGQEGQNQR